MGASQKGVYGAGPAGGVNQAVALGAELSGRPVTINQDDGSAHASETGSASGWVDGDRTAVGAGVRGHLVHSSVTLVPGDSASPRGIFCQPCGPCGPGSLGPSSALSARKN